MGFKGKDRVKNLKPIHDTNRAKKIGKMGGLSKSAKKVTQSRLNGLLNNKNLSPDMRHILSSMRNRNYSEVLNELISMNVEKADDIEVRNKAIDQLQKFMPTKVMNINTNLNIDVDQDNKEVDAHLKKLFGKNK